VLQALAGLRPLVRVHRQRLGGVVVRQQGRQGARGRWTAAARRCLRVLHVEMLAAHRHGAARRHATGAAVVEVPSSVAASAAARGAPGAIFVECLGGSMQLRRSGH